MAKQRYQKVKNNQGVLEVIFIGIFKILWFLIKLPFSRGKRNGLSQSDKNGILNRRLLIEKMLTSDNQYELSHALMEADKLVDNVLRMMGYSGETFADRLRSAEDQIEPVVYDGIWQGHKVRNILAHEQSSLSMNEIRNAANKLLRYVKNVK